MEFNGQYYFLSNSYQYPFDMEIGGEMYRFLCVEGAINACMSPSRAYEFQNMTGKEAKESRKKIRKRETVEGWDEIKLSEYKRCVRAKFSSSNMETRLINTPEKIVMENSYHDTYWGVYNGRGKNTLGRILEEVREEIREKRGLSVKKEVRKPSYKIQRGGTVAFDTETTGLSGKYDEILQITIVGEDGNALLNTYIKPERSISWEESQKIHHITPEMVKNAPNKEEVAKAVRYIFSNVDTVIGYNVSFDVKMVSSDLGYDFNNNDVIDILPLYRKLDEEKTKEARAFLNEEKKRLRKELKKEGISSSELTSKVNEIIEERYKEEFEIANKKHKLLNAVEEFCPEDFETFEYKAHDACEDTRETMKVGKIIAKKYGIELPHCIDTKDKLFGLESGIVCHQMNCQGEIGSGFTYRICNQYPSLKNDLKKNYMMSRLKKSSLFGKLVMSNIGSDLQVANIYAQYEFGDSRKTGEKYTDTEQLVTSILVLCKQNPEKNVYLPIVSKPKVNSEEAKDDAKEGKSKEYKLEILDGIGCGKAGEIWSNLEPKLEELNMPNLYYVDTQTFSVFRVKDRKMEKMGENEIDYKKYKKEQEEANTQEAKDCDIEENALKNEDGLLEIN